MAVAQAIRRIKPLLDVRSARLGVGLGFVSLALALVGLNNVTSPCTLLTSLTTYASAHKSVGLIALGAWSFFLFLTVLPFGTVTILLAGYFLGPVAGIVQYLSLIAASMVLYEIGREQDPRLVEKRLVEFPALAKSANFARRKGLEFSALMRLIPIVPSAVASIAASYFGITRQQFLLGTIIAGWCRPVGFAVLGHLGRFSPVCGIDPVAIQVSI